MDVWNALLLVYPEIDVRFRRQRRFPERFKRTLSAAELRDGIDSFKEFPALVEDLSGGEAGIRPEIIRAERPLDSVSPVNAGSFWPTPTDIWPEICRYAPPGRFDSIFVFWPQCDLERQTGVPFEAWGMASGPFPGTNGATYAVVANARTYAWRIPMEGEVWLHEWLHGVCACFAALGFKMPAYDADGGGSHGYVQSPTTGWTDYYRDLMTGNVNEDGKQLGIPPEAWRKRIRPVLST